MSHIGVWIDLREAIITKGKTLEEQSLAKINSNIDVGHVKGGSGSSTPYGPQDAVSESKFLEKKNHELKDYFDRVAEKVVGAKMLLICGPAETKNKLFEDFGNRHEFKNTAIFQKTTDSMTDNQFKALVREFISNL